MKGILPVLAAAVAASFSVPSAAQERNVVVNGQPLHSRQVTRIEGLFCSPIADGHEGDPQPQGQFINRCASNGGRTPLSQRGMLDSMSEILSGRQ